MRTLWCLWFASSMAMPYLLGFAEPAGIVAYAGSYGFAALGMILGLWFATYPYPAFKRHRSDAPNVWFGLLLLGLLLCAALGLFELGRLAPLRSIPLPPWATHWNTLAAPVEKPLVFCNALLCGIVGVRIAPMKPEAQTVTWHHRFLLIVAFLAGLTRGTAWTLLLPSPSHPLPPTGWRLNPEDYWVDMLPVGVDIALVLACGLAWAWLATRRCGPLAKPALVPTIGALCLGELSWRFATRIVPSWLDDRMHRPSFL